MGPEIEVEISDTQGHLTVDPAAIDKLVRLVLLAEDRPRASISIALVDNAAIHAVNRAYLRHDWPTDVISFPLSDPADAVLTGELVISTETACATARQMGADAADELALYVVHGLLHLCGFDDHAEVDVRQMRAREQELLARAGLGKPDRRPLELAVVVEVEAPFPPRDDGGGGGPGRLAQQPEARSWMG
jgi:probable rRNA maturation factor